MVSISVTRGRGPQGKDPLHLSERTRSSRTLEGRPQADGKVSRATNSVHLRNGAGGVKNLLGPVPTAHRSPSVPSGDGDTVRKERTNMKPLHTILSGEQVRVLQVVLADYLETYSDLTSLTPEDLAFLSTVSQIRDLLA